MSTSNRTFLTITEAGSQAPLLFDSDGTTFVVDNAANIYVCNDNRLFIGPLIDSNVTLDIANRNQGISLKTGPTRIAWEEESGETFAYEFKDVVYNPSSPFNILSVVELVITLKVYTLLQLMIKKAPGEILFLLYRFYLGSRPFHSPVCPLL